MAGIDKRVEERKVKRMRFFDGLFLREEEFNLEQEYQVRMRRLHNRHLHTPGVVNGLDVMAQPVEACKVTITPGLALLTLLDYNKEEEYGQEILVGEPVELDLGASGYQADQTVYIYLDFAEEKVDVVEDRGGSEKIHWWEKPVITHTAKLDPSAGKLLLAAVGFQTSEKWGLIVNPAKIDYSGRSYAGAYGKLTLSVPRENSDLPYIAGAKVAEHNAIEIHAPFVRYNGEIQVNEVSLSSPPQAKVLQLEGDLAISGNLTVNGSATTVHTETLVVEDNIIQVNQCTGGNPQKSGGLEVNRGERGGNAQLLWDEEQSGWTLGTVGQPVNITNLTNQSVTDIHRHDRLVNPDGKTVVTVDATGKVGIGTETPRAALEVTGVIQAHHTVLEGASPALRLIGTEKIEPGKVEEFKNLSAEDLERLVSKDWLIEEDCGLLKIGVLSRDENAGIKNLFSIDSLNGIVKAAAFEGDGSHLSGLVNRWRDMENVEGIVYKGRVGIGTDQPGTELEVGGTITARSYIGDGSQLTGLGAKWRELSEERLTYPGKVGIGVAEPKVALEVQGTLNVRNAAGESVLWVGDQVGIGTEIPQAGLHIASKRNSLIVSGSSDGDETDPVAKIVLGGEGLKESGTIFNQKISAEKLDLLNVHCQGESRLLVQSNGNVGIGTNAPNMKLQVMGDISCSDNFYVRNIFCSGNLVVSGAKSGYVVDLFINRLEEPVEEGDVVVINANQNTLYYGANNNIPIPEIDLAAQLHDRRVCGIVSEVHGLPESEGFASAFRSFSAEELAGQERTKAGSDQMGFMVTLGAYAHCKVDADIAPIEIGDLLTTSPTKGHAQKALKPEKAVGAIIGKALAPLNSGKGKIPVLVMIK